MSKYNRTYHLPYSPGTTSDDRISKSVSSLLNVPIIITEKLDGGNICMTNELLFERSHAAPSFATWTQKVRQLHSTIKHYIPNDDLLYGEGLEAIHSIKYDNIKSSFYLFAIKNDNKWFSWDEIEEYSFLLDIPTVPVLFEGIVNNEKELEDLVNKLSNEESALGGLREGIVVRIRESFNDDEFSSNVQKWVRKNHVQSDEHWKRNWKKATIKNYD